MDQKTKDDSHILMWLNRAKAIKDSSSNEPKVEGFLGEKECIIEKCCFFLKNNAPFYRFCVSIRQAG